MAPEDVVSLIASSSSQPAPRSHRLRFDRDPNETSEEVVVVGRHAVHIETGQNLRFRGEIAMEVDRFVWEALRGTIEVEIFNCIMSSEGWSAVRSSLWSGLFVVGMFMLIFGFSVIEFGDVLWLFRSHDDDDDDDDEDGKEHPEVDAWVLIALVGFFGLVLQWAWKSHEKREKKEAHKRTAQTLESIVADFEFPNPCYSAVITDGTNNNGWKLVTLRRMRTTEEAPSLKFSLRKNKDGSPSRLSTIEVPVSEFLCQSPLSSASSVVVVDRWTWGRLKPALDDERLKRGRSERLIARVGFASILFPSLYLVRYHVLSWFPIIPVMVLLCLLVVALYFVYEEHRIAPGLHHQCTAIVEELAPKILEYCQLHVSYHVRTTRWRRTQGILRFQEDGEEEDGEELRLVV